VVDHVFGVVVGGVYRQVLDVLAQEEFSCFCAVVGLTWLDFSGAVFEFYLPLVAGAVELVGLGRGEKARVALPGWGPGAPACCQIAVAG